MAHRYEECCLGCGKRTGLKFHSVEIPPTPLMPFSHLTLVELCQTCEEDFDIYDPDQEKIAALLRLKFQEFVDERAKTRHH
jgi:hypothetical protein